MVLSILACIALVLAALYAFCCYMDWLACLLFLCALIPSCLFEEGRRELKRNK